METQTFADQLIAARRAAGLTQAQLAEEMHMSRQGISHWENGRALPDAEMLKLLSRQLNYDFVTDDELRPEKETPPEASSAGGRKPLWRQPVLWLSAAVVVLAAALVIVLMSKDGGLSPDALPRQVSGGGQTIPVRQVEQADVRIIPAQNPITPSCDPVLGPEPWWIYRLTLQEVAGVDYTIEKMTTTYRYTDGRTTVVEQGAETIAANANTGSNVLSRGMNIFWNGAEPLYDFADITVRLDGTDARGHVLSFECVIDCALPASEEAGE